MNPTRDSHFDRLSALDATFLDIENACAPMHVGAALLFDAKPLTTDHGGLDFERLLAYVESRLDNLPQYRRRLAFTPGFGHPVWVDDERFNIRFHVRHTRLPLPGNERELKRLTGRLFSQPLDRARPLWEFWFVEGVEGDRFALIPKVHHCMVDGVGGAELVQSLFSVSPVDTFEQAKPFKARPAPGPLSLVRAETTHRVRGLRHLRDHAKRIVDNAQGLGNILRSGLRPADRTPFTETDVSPFRRFDWTSVSLADIKAIKKEFGGTVNDVIVATTTGAARRFLLRKGVDVEALKHFRAVLPVNTRNLGTGAGGNHVAMLLAELPVAEHDPVDRMHRVIEITTELKGRSNQVIGADIIEQIADDTTKNLLSQLFKTAMRVRTYNMIITNVPGPPIPLYLLQAPMQGLYPMVPLMQNQNLGIALFSYSGHVYWGFNADWESFPDVHEFVEDIEFAFEELKQAAGVNATSGPLDAARV